VGLPFRFRLSFWRSFLPFCRFCRVRFLLPASAAVSACTMPPCRSFCRSAGFTVLGGCVLLCSPARHLPPATCLPHQRLPLPFRSAVHLPLPYHLLYCLPAVYTTCVSFHYLPAAFTVSFLRSFHRSGFSASCLPFCVSCHTCTGVSADAAVSASLRSACLPACNTCWACVPFWILPAVLPACGSCLPAVRTAVLPACCLPRRFCRYRSAAAVSAVLRRRHLPFYTAFCLPPPAFGSACLGRHDYCLPAPHRSRSAAFWVCCCCLLVRSACLPAVLDSAFLPALDFLPAACLAVACRFVSACLP